MLAVLHSYARYHLIITNTCMPGLLRLRGLAPVLRPRLQPRLQLRQGSGMGAGGPRGYGQGEYRGLKVPKPEPWQSNVATFYGTMLWLWIFYRFKQDGKALFVRGPGTRTLFPGRRPVQADSTLVAQLSSCFPACAGSGASVGCARPPRRPRPRPRPRPSLTYCISHTRSLLAIADGTCRL